MPVTKELIYKDLDFKFDRHPVTGKITVLTNNAAVKQAVKLLVLTNKYERFYQPNLGSDVNLLLFENYDSMTQHMIQKAIEEAIDNFETRADLIDVVVNGYPDQNGLDITVFFRVVNQREPVEARITLERLS